MKRFLIFFFASQIFGILGVIFVLVVVVHRKHNTSALSPGSSNEFLWHPVLMSLSFGYLFGTSITIYRALRYMRKKLLKQVHAAIHLSVIAFSIGGLVTAFDMFYSIKAPHLRVLHSLMGIITVILFCIQWVFSFLLFLYPKGPGLVRAMMMPYHVIGGLILFVTSLCTIVTGINSFNNNWMFALDMEGVMLNFAGFFFLINALLVAYMVLRDDYKRQPIDEDHEGESEETTYD